MSNIFNALHEINQRLEQLQKLVQKLVKGVGETERGKANNQPAVPAQPTRKLKLDFYLELLGGLLLFGSWLFQNEKLAQLQDKEREFVRLEAADLTYNSLLATTELGYRFSNHFALLTSNRPVFLEDSVYLKNPQELSDHRSASVIMEDRMEYATALIHISNRIKEIRLQILHLNDEQYSDQWLAAQLDSIQADGWRVRQHAQQGDMFQLNTVVNRMSQDLAWGEAKEAVIASRVYLARLRKKIHGISSWYFWLYVVGASLVGAGFLLSRWKPNPGVNNGALHPPTSLSPG